MYSQSRMWALQCCPLADIISHSVAFGVLWVRVPAFLQAAKPGVPWTRDRLIARHRVQGRGQGSYEAAHNETLKRSLAVRF